MLAGLAEEKPQLLEPRAECILGRHRVEFRIGWWEVQLVISRRQPTDVPQALALRSAGPTSLAKPIGQPPKSDFRHRDHAAAAAI